MPPPPPSTLRIRVTNCLTGQPLNQVQINLSGNMSRTTDSTGLLTYFPIPVGAYTVFAHLGGHSDNQTETGPIGTNMTVEVAMCLNPLPCTLIVRTVLNSDGSALPGVAVSLGNALIADQTTPASGEVRFTIPANVFASLVSGKITGYEDEQSSFTCPQGNETLVVLRFDPLPARINVQVLDERTGDPIPTARVTLTVSTFPEVGVDTQARTSFFPVIAPATYTAAASAAGYTSNSTTTGPVARNQTVSVIIYLRELPCVVTVTVLVNDTGLPLDAAGVSLNMANSSRLTDAAGQTVYTIRYDAANNASGVKSGHSSDSAGFVCTRGALVNVTLRLNRVLQIRIAAVDASTSGFPFLPSAMIYINGTLMTDKDPESNYYLRTVSSFPFDAVITAEALGFNPKGASAPVRFSLTRMSYNVSLAPQEFNLYFTPGEVVDGTGFLAVRSDGVILNNVAKFVNIDSTYVYASGRHDIKTGGSATQDVTPEINQPFSTLNFTARGPDGVIRSYNAYAAVFTAQVPTSQFQFVIKKKNLDTLVFQTPDNASIPIQVPEFTATSDRHLLFNIPYKLNAAYFVTRQTTINVAQTQRVPYSGADFALLRVFLFGSQVKFINLDGPAVSGKTFALFEISIVFGDRVTAIECSGPPETFSPTLSNWLDDSVDGGIKPFLPGEAPAGYLAFSWPPVDLSETLFRPNGFGQLARDTNARLYLMRDWVHVRLPAKKRDE